jgi:cell division GTPase FtsZ
MVKIKDHGPRGNSINQSSPEVTRPAPAPNPSKSGVSLPDVDDVGWTPPGETVEQVDEVEQDEFDGAVKMAFIGAGQGGGRIAQSFYDCGYRRVLALNTTQQDLEPLTMPEENKMLIGDNRGGAGKDPEAGYMAAKESFEDIMDRMMRRWGEGVEMLYVCVGAGGGSGTGSWHVIVDAMKEYAKSTNVEKPLHKHLGVIMTLPKRSEGARVQKNANIAVKYALELLSKKRIASLILVDNARIHELYPGLPVKKFWTVANRNFTAILHTFNLLAAQNSEYNTFDRADFRSVLHNGLMIFGMTKVESWLGKEDISQAVRQNLTGTLLAEGFDLATANIAGAIVVAHDDVLNEIPMENIDYAFNSLGRALGNEGVMLHNGIYEGNSPGMRVFTIVSGLEPPKERLDELDKLSD